MSAVAHVKVDSICASLVEGHTPGLCLAIAGERGVLWEGAWGLSDLDAGRAMSTDRMLPVGSITKSFIAIVFLQLVNEGRLDLAATPVALLGADLDGIANADRANLDHLLTHASGIPSWEDDSAWIRVGRGADCDPDRVWSPREPLEYVRGKPAIAAPGEKYSYSNTNYTLLGLIVEAVTGRAVADEIRTRVLAPLGLHDVILEGFEGVLVERRASRYHHATEAYIADAGLNPAWPMVRPGLIDVSHSNLSVEWAAGGLVATVRDLAAFASALHRGAGPLCDVRAAMGDWAPWRDGLDVGRGLLRRRLAGGGFAIGHDGGVLGGSATYFWVEEQPLAVAAAWNAGTMHAGPAGAVILDALRSEAFIEAAAALVERAE